MSRINSFFISFFHKKVGEDILLNEYYESKKLNYIGRSKRFVIYKKTNEPTKIPPMWHAWLHHMINEVPNNISNVPWQKNYGYSKFEPKTANSTYSRWKP